MEIDEIKAVYAEIKDTIRGKLYEFENVFNKSDEEIFLELCFCILAAGTSASLALKTVENIRNIVFTADREEMQRALKSHRYRFHTVRAEYIVSTRDYLKKDCCFRIKEKIRSFRDKEKLRDFFSANRGIRGIAYKEGSHFLRNIGYRGYAILDKHVINSLYELGAIESPGRPANKKSYIETECAMKKFAERIGIDFDELDLLLWYSKTGEIIK